MPTVTRSTVLVAITLVLVAFACAPQAAKPSDTTSAPGAVSAAPAPAHASRVAIGVWAEAPALQPKLMNRPAAGYHMDASYLVNSPLVVLDAQGAPRPRLAAELPSRDNGAWTVNDD